MSSASACFRCLRIIRKQFEVEVNFEWKVLTERSANSYLKACKAHRFPIMSSDKVKRGQSVSTTPSVPGRRSSTGPSICARSAAPTQTPWHFIIDFLDAQKLSHHHSTALDANESSTLTEILALRRRICFAACVVARFPGCYLLCTCAVPLLFPGSFHCTAPPRLPQDLCTYILLLAMY